MYSQEADELRRRADLVFQILHVAVRHLGSIPEASDWCACYRQGLSLEDLLESGHGIVMQVESPDTETRQLLADIESEIG